MGSSTKHPFTVTARGLAAVEVEQPNWIMALGAGLHELGKSKGVLRLACEVLPNGTVIARDISSGTGYIVQGLEATDDAQEVEVMEFGEPEPTDVEPLDERTEELEDLPADAILELAPEEDQMARIDRAETSLLACKLALDVARERVPAESGAVILAENGYLRFTAVNGPHSRKLTGVRLPMGTGVAGFAMAKQRTVVLADAHNDPRHCGEVDALTGYQTREIAVVPIMWDNEVKGVVELMNLEGGRRFLEADVDQLTEVADALAARLGQ